MEKKDYFYTEHLSVGYHSLPLIEDINIHLRRGEILTLIGPNGSGKSTILKSITRYLKTVYGTVYLDSSDVGQMSGEAFAKQTAVVFTEKLRTELMTCEDVVAAGRYPYTGRFGILSGEDRKKVWEAMELVRVLSVKDCDFTQVSDGQRQRVLLARAICQEPQLIVLDEPTSFLDIRYKLELLTILRKLAEEKKLAVILSVHELDLAQKIADYVLCVKDGAVFAYGPPEKIFEKDRIQELYGLDNGSYNPMFGSLEMKKPEGKAEIFVIGGGGSGMESYRLLQKKGIPFITGILHKNDVDFQVAEALAAQIIAEECFEPIAEETFQRAAAALQTCRVLLNCPERYGTMNRRNEELSKMAQTLGILQINGQDAAAAYILACEEEERHGA